MDKADRAALSLHGDSGALHLGARHRACSTVWGSTADRLGAGVSGGLRWEYQIPVPY